FTGEGNSSFKASDAKTGAVRRKFDCGADANAAPSVFEVRRAVHRRGCGRELPAQLPTGQHGLRLRAAEGGEVTLNCWAGLFPGTQRTGEGPAVVISVDDVRCCVAAVKP